MTHQGPTNITSSARVCGLCQCHRQHTLKSGDRPEYKHFCGHPVSVEYVRERKGGFESYLCPKEDGREIGYTDNTPGWCPVVAENLQGDRAPGAGLTAGGPVLDPLRKSAIVQRVVDIIRLNVRQARCDAHDLARAIVDDVLDEGRRRAEEAYDIPQFPASGRAQEPSGGESKSPGTWEVVEGGTLGYEILDSRRATVADVCSEAQALRFVDALETVALIEELRGEAGSGDSVEIFAESIVPKQNLAVCSGRWTNQLVQCFRDENTLLAALRKAAEAKRKIRGGSLLKDSEVTQWLKAMDELAMLPKQRNKR